MSQRKRRFINLPSTMIRMCKKRKFRSKVADSLGADLAGGQLLMRTLILRRILLRQVLDSDEQHVGILLPPSAAALSANVALTLDQRVAINLNYSASAAVINQCIAQAAIKHVLTSRLFVETLRRLKDKADFSLEAESVYLEDFRQKATWLDKLTCALAAYCVPAAVLCRALQLEQVDEDDVVTIIFTSGSTGTPKGVMLTHANIASNVQGVDQIINLRRSDVVMGVLPFFHSFGYTVPLWTVAAMDIKAVYHVNPLEARQIGHLVQKHRATVLLVTPTFLRRTCGVAHPSSLRPWM